MNRKNKIILSLSILATILLAISLSYAFFRSSKVQEDNNIITTLDCLSTTLTNVNSAINLTNSFPVTDEKGLTSVPYTFKITNNCSKFIKVDINLDVLSETTFSSNYVKVALNKDYKLLSSYDVATQTVSGATSYNLIKNIDLRDNQSITYDLRLWIDEPTTIEQGLNKVFYSKIVVLATPIGNITLKNLGDVILEQGGGVEAIALKPAPDFSIINGVSGIYSTEDEYGTSYYYRGEKNELDNNLLWAGFQWKIIRINGDGSIRLLYNGTEEQFDINGTVNSTEDTTHISRSTWNPIRDDAKYVGYMFGGPSGAASTMRHGSTSAAATFNETDPNVKTILDNWYKTNIFDAGYSNVVVDNLFCSDRRLRSEVGGAATGQGFGNPGGDIVYASYYRNMHNKIPDLKCGLQNDKFTVNDTSLGNGSLTYPVGLITADEAAMAGTKNGSTNETNFLYTSNSFWSFSPGFMSAAGNAHVFYIMATGELSNGFVTNNSGIRPVVSIDSITQVSGSGTANDPFRV